MKPSEFYLTNLAYRAAAERQFALARITTGNKSNNHALKAARYLQRWGAGLENNLPDVVLEFSGTQSSDDKR